MHGASYGRLVTKKVVILLYICFMPAKIKKKGKLPYLTTRRLISASRKGIRKAAQETMALRGFNLVVEGKWLVRKFANGRIERISRITKPSKSKIFFD
jgi:hypothetical protein